MTTVHTTAQTRTKAFPGNLSRDDYDARRIASSIAIGDTDGFAVAGGGLTTTHNGVPKIDYSRETDTTTRLELVKRFGNGGLFQTLGNDPSKGVLISYGDVGDRNITAVVERRGNRWVMVEHFIGPKIKP